MNSPFSHQSKVPLNEAKKVNLEEAEGPYLLLCGAVSLRFWSLLVWGLPPSCLPSETLLLS